MDGDAKDQNEYMCDVLFVHIASINVCSQTCAAVHMTGLTGVTTLVLPTPSSSHCHQLLFPFAYTRKLLLSPFVVHVSLTSIEQ